VTTTTDNEAAAKMSIEDVVINVKHSVVEIQTERISTSRFMREFVSTGAGSGVIISTDGYIVTNDHVISGAKSITVRLSNEQEYQATLIGTDAQTDLAVLKINATGLQPAIMGHSSGLLVGQTAIAIGNPLGELGGTVTAGIISALDREITIGGETMSLLQTDAAVNPGNSGGGLFNLYGELIGVVNAKSSGSEIEGLGFAIPIDFAQIVIEQLIEYGFVRGRVDSGFVLVDIQDAFTAMSYRIQQLGLYISNSISTDFQNGDRITAVDGQTVRNLAEWNSRMSKYNVGDTVNITVVRNGSSISLALTLTEQTG
jgi:serine protease Do